MRNFPVIKTNRLLLRAISSDDIPAVFEIFSSEKVTDSYDCDAFTDESQAKDWVEENISAYEFAGHKGFRWGVSLIEAPNNLIGSCGFHNINQIYHSVEVGYELHPDFWGMGLATEAVAAIIHHGFTHNFPISINRIVATTDIVSPKSVSVLSKLGFKEEGLLREYGYWKSRFHDVRLFSLLRKDQVNLIERKLCN